MAATLIAHTIAGAATTSAIDTTGANLICVYVASDNAAGCTDSKGNTYVLLTQSSTGNPGACRMFYCLNPTVGSGHTFTASGGGFPAVAVAAFNNVASYVSEHVNASSGSSGSLTPGVNNCLLVTAVGTAGTPTAVDSGFTITDTIGLVGGVHYAAGMAYLLQTTSASVNATWTTGSANTTATIVAFASSAPSAVQQPMIQFIT